MVSIIISLTLIVIVIIITFGILAYDEDESVVQTLCQTLRYISENNKEIELRRLKVLEESPELKKIILNPKIMKED